MDKDTLRKDFLVRRRAMSREDVVAKSASIAARLAQLDVLRAGSPLLTYVSSKDNEVDTLGIIRGAITGGREVLVPVAEPKGVLTWSRLAGLEELAEGRFGILEPKPECRRIVAPPDGAVCLVPGIAFTRQGYRIGYGGGYFDRFLAQFRGTSIGLAFELQLLQAVTLEIYDVSVDVVVTEKDTYWRDIIAQGRMP